MRSVVEQTRMIDLETGEVFAENLVREYILTETDTYEDNPNFDDHYDSEEPADVQTVQDMEEAYGPSDRDNWNI